LLHAFLHGCLPITDRRIEMSEYRFGLHSGEVSEYLFGLHNGHLTAVADQIAGRHGAWHINYTEPCGERRGWFACPNRGPSFYQVIARAVMADIDRAGGIETLCRDEREPAADEFCASMQARSLMTTFSAQTSAENSA
jgi:hypothetical protein